MTPHWTERRSGLQHWLASSPRILVGCDFDGTLVPIVEHADDAALPQGTRRALERLAALPGMIVAVISGRSLNDLRQRIGLRSVLYAGNHGLEITGPGGTDAVVLGAETGREQLVTVVAQLTTMLSRVPGVWIEDKHLSASVHYRMASVDHHALIGEIVSAALKGVDELALRQGKCVWDVRPSATWDKGSALRCFMTRCGVSEREVAYFGDDVTDCDAFAVVPEGWTGVVGEVVSQRARVRLRDPEDMAALLAWMTDVRLSAF